VTKHKGEGGARRAPDASDDGEPTASAVESGGASSGLTAERAGEGRSDGTRRPRPQSGDGASGRDERARSQKPQEDAKMPGRRGKAAANETASPRGARRSAPEQEGLRSEDEGHEHEEDHGEEGDEPIDAAADGEIIDAVGEIVDEESVDPDTAKAVDRTLRSDLPDREEAALSRTDPLQAYLREVQRHKLLTPDEEKELTQKFVSSQDARIAARLVTANLRLVVKLAYEYRRAYKNIMDLIQEGNIGLMQAVKRYDPYRGVKLSSYAAWWIRAYILRFILNNWRLVKLGTTQAQRKLFFNLNKEKAKLAAMGIEPEASEIAKRLGVEEKEVIDMDRRLSSGEASLDAPVGDSDGRAVSRLDMMPSALHGPDVAFEQEEMGQLVKERLAEFRKTLKGKDVVIFDKRMSADEPLTLQELGDEFGISRERVRQLEARLTHKLRIYLKQEFGDAVEAG
jgi:RNA polymerase sigma-32 factor